MKTENNFLLYKLKRAIRKKYQIEKKNDYGIKDENNIVSLIQSTIKKKGTERG